jgi:hypothetical protein
MPPVIKFKNGDAVSQTNKILATLPEYAQDQFFSSNIQRYLIDKLKLESEHWLKLIDGIWHHLGESGYVVVKGLPFDVNNRLSVALACMLGKPVPHNSKIPSVVREIRPRPNSGLGPEPFENLPHTDSPHWIHPNDLITLQCKKEDQSMDVYSRIAPVWAVEELIKERTPEFYHQLLEEKYPFILIPADGDGGMQMQPILSRVNEGSKERSHVRYCYPDSKHCIAEYDLEDDYLGGLEQVLKAAQEVSEWNQFLFHKGDWLIFDNKRTFHSKTDTSENTDRVLKKIKLQVDRDKIYN